MGNWTKITPFLALATRTMGNTTKITPFLGIPKRTIGNTTKFTIFGPRQAHYVQHDQSASGEVEKT